MECLSLSLNSLVWITHLLKACRQHWGESMGKMGWTGRLIDVSFKPSKTYTALFSQAAYTLRPSVEFLNTDLTMRIQRLFWVLLGSKCTLQSRVSLTGPRCSRAWVFWRVSPLHASPSDQLRLRSRCIQNWVTMRESCEISLIGLLIPCLWSPSSSVLTTASHAVSRTQQVHASSGC